MNIIVTGASGAVGSKLINIFKNKFDNIIAIERTGQKNTIENVYYYTCDDLSNQDLVKKTFKRIFDQFDSIDALINVAGGFDMGTNVENISNWNTMLDINFYSMLNATISVLPHMKKNKFGRIINFGSEAAYNGIGLAAPYCISKAAVQSFTQSLSHELSDNVTCNAVVPSIINTKANQNAMPQSDYSKWIQIEDIAETILDIINEDYSGRLISF